MRPRGGHHLEVSLHRPRHQLGVREPGRHEESALATGRSSRSLTRRTPLMWRTGAMSSCTGKVSMCLLPGDSHDDALRFCLTRADRTRPLPHSDDRLRPGSARAGVRLSLKSDLRQRFPKPGVAGSIPAGGTMCIVFRVMLDVPTSLKDVEHGEQLLAGVASTLPFQPSRRHIPSSQGCDQRTGHGRNHHDPSPAGLHYRRGNSVGDVEGRGEVHRQFKVPRRDPSLGTQET